MNKTIKTLILLSVSWITVSAFAATAPEAPTTYVGNHAEPDSTLQARATIPAPGHRFRVGDTIVISKQQTHYLTGEHIDAWVYDVRHRIKRVGSRRFPRGLYLQGINSWISPKDVLMAPPIEPVSAPEQQPALEPKPAPTQQPAQEQKVAPVQEPTPVAKPEPAPVVAEPEPAPQPAVAEPAVVAELEPEVKAPVAEAPAEPVAAEAEAKRQFNRFGIGLRGGAASMMQQTIAPANGQWQIGFDALLDLQYAHYWQRGSKPACGILTGLSVGYARNGVKANGDRTFDIQDEDLDDIRYTVTGADATEQDGSVLIEVPVLFSMIAAEHFFLNIGPRVSLPVFSHYDQTLAPTHIDAWNRTKNVHVTDQLITGKVTDDLLRQKGATKLARLNVLLSCELGYEQPLKNGQAIGIGLYGDYSVFSLYPGNPTGKELIGIVPPSSASPALVSVAPLTEALVPRNGLGFFDCGLKLIYHFKVW